MSYDVGTHIDLSGINKPRVVEKKEAPEPRRTLYQVGTQFVFKIVNGETQMAIKIPVALA